MKKLTKGIVNYCLLLLLTLGLLAVLTFSLSRYYGKDISFFFKIDGYDVTVTPWARAKKDYCVFVPSFCSVGDLVIETDAASGVAIGDSTYKNGDTLKGLSPDTEYVMRASGASCKVTFYESANIPALFVDTSTGTMKNVLNKKGTAEDASVSLFDEKGNTAYSDGKASIKGRGNGSWNSYKKAFLLTFDERVSLFGMKDSDKYVLLANGADETNLRNKVIYDMAAQICGEWTPRCEFVDLYLNGEYNGLYLVAEKIEVSDEKLAGGDEGELRFLCEINYGEDDQLAVKKDNQFISKADQLFQIEYTADGMTMADVESLVAQMDGLFVGDASGKASIDRHSWACKYILDEFSENGDAAIRSNWFYCREKDGAPVFYAGPIWDYDYSMGRDLGTNSNPKTFTARRKYRTKTQTSPYYASLYADDEYNEYLRSVYENEFRPAMEKYLSDYPALCEKIAASAKMNSTRWEELFRIVREGKRSTVCSPEQLYDYMKERLGFLDSAWIDGVDYKMVQIESKVTNSFMYFSVVKGEALPKDELEGYIDANDSYTDFFTGEKFDLGDGIEEDMILVRQTAATARRNTVPRQTLLLCGGVIAVMILFMISFAVIEWRRYRGR